MNIINGYVQVEDETNVLQDGTLIDLCGATLLWRSADGLAKSPVSFSLYYVTNAGLLVSGST